MQCIKTITIQPFRITVNRSSMEEMLFVIKCDCYFIFGKGLRVVRQINNRHIDILSNIDVTNDTNYIRFSQQFNNIDDAKEHIRNYELIAKKYEKAV